MYSRALVLFLSGAIGLIAACATLQSAVDPAQAFIDCTAKAFEPVAGSVERAQELSRQVRAGEASVGEILDAAKATAEEATNLDRDLRVCVAQAKADAEALKAGAQ
jgi:ABC-type transporter Mla subunit MlaD